MNDKVIQIGGKSYKKCDVVMLPTDKASIIALNTHNNQLILATSLLQSKKEDAIQMQHLYILSDEKIKEGDWCLIDNNVGMRTGYQIKQCLEADIPNGEYTFKDDDNELFTTGRCEKIIATTDSDLGRYIGGKSITDWESLPKPSDDFIKALVKAQSKINEVLVEYEDKGEMVADTGGRMLMGWYDGDNLPRKWQSNFQLKVAKDNTITIKPFEEKTSWNRDELIIILNKFGNNIYGEYIRNKTMLDFVHKWIEENL